LFFNPLPSERSPPALLPLARQESRWARVKKTKITRAGAEQEEQRRGEHIFFLTAPRSKGEAEKNKNFVFMAPLVIPLLVPRKRQENKQRLKKIFFYGAS
jgi:hypothetical protein